MNTMIYQSVGMQIHIDYFRWPEVCALKRALVASNPNICSLKKGEGLSINYVIFYGGRVQVKTTKGGWGWTQKTILMIFNLIVFFSQDIKQSFKNFQLKNLIFHLSVIDSSYLFQSKNMKMEAWGQIWRNMTRGRDSKKSWNSYDVV